MKKTSLSESAFLMGLFSSAVFLIAFIIGFGLVSFIAFAVAYFAFKIAVMYHKF